MLAGATFLKLKIVDIVFALLRAPSDGREGAVEAALVVSLAVLEVSDCCGIAVSLPLTSSQFEVRSRDFFQGPVEMAETAEQEVVVSFTSTLLTLTWNSKDIINALTIHAHTHTRYATALTTALALHLGISFSGTDHICNRRMQAPRKVGFVYSLGIIHLLARYVLGGTPNAARLPSLYALDSILKNIGAPYPALIAPALPRVIETVWSLCTAPEDRGISNTRI